MTSLADRAASVDAGRTVRRDNRRPDPATDEVYAHQLAVETDRTLRHSPNWRAGRPLDDHSTRCDCPPLTGCVERWPRGPMFSNSIIGRSKLDAAGRPPGQANQPKTHCPKGHPYDQANTIWKAGHRKCRTCLHASRVAAR